MISMANIMAYIAIEYYLSSINKNEIENDTSGLGI